MVPEGYWGDGRAPGTFWKAEDSMFSIILVIFLLVTLAMIGVVLMQRSEGGALGIGGGGGGGGGGFMTGRGTANLLTRVTAVLAACFMGLSVVLTILSATDRGGDSLLDGLGGSDQLAPLAPLPAEEGAGEGGAGAAGENEGEPSAPSVPVQ